MSYAARLFSGFAKPLLTMFLSDWVILYPDGNLATPVALRALVALDTELGTNEVPGDGAVTRGTEGDRERRTGRIELPVNLPQADTLTPATLGGTYSVTINGATVSYSTSSTTFSDVLHGLVLTLRASTNPNFVTLHFSENENNISVTGSPGFAFTLTATNLTHATVVSAGRRISENDLWRIDGELWTTQRQDARDSGTNAAYQGWRITTKLGRRTQHSLLKDTRPVGKG